LVKEGLVLLALRKFEWRGEGEWGEYRGEK